MRKSNIAPLITIITILVGTLTARGDDVEIAGYWIRDGGLGNFLYTVHRGNIVFPSRAMLNLRGPVKALTTYHNVGEGKDVKWKVADKFTFDESGKMTSAIRGTIIFEFTYNAEGRLDAITRIRTPENVDGNVFTAKFDYEYSKNILSSITYTETYRGPGNKIIQSNETSKWLFERPQNLMISYYSNISDNAAWVREYRGGDAFMEYASGELGNSNASRYKIIGSGGYGTRQVLSVRRVKYFDPNTNRDVNKLEETPICDYVYKGNMLTRISYAGQDENTKVILVYSDHDAQDNWITKSNEYNVLEFGKSIVKQKVLSKREFAYYSESSTEKSKAVLPAEDKPPLEAKSNNNPRRIKAERMHAQAIDFLRDGNKAAAIAQLRLVISEYGDITDIADQAKKQLQELLAPK